MLVGEVFWGIINEEKNNLRGRKADIPNTLSQGVQGFDQPDAGWSNCLLLYYSDPRVCCMGERC